MVYSKSDKRFIACLVGGVLALLVLVQTCADNAGYRGPYVDDGGDHATELDEYNER